MFLCFELSFDLLTCINRLDNGIDLSTEVTELVSYLISDFWPLDGKTILMGDSVHRIFVVDYILGNFHSLKTPVCKTSTFQASYFNRIAKLWNYICKFSPLTSFSTTASFRNFVTEHVIHLLHSHFFFYIFYCIFKF